MQISDYPYVDKVFENLRKKLRLSSYTLDAKTNVLIWGLFTSTTMKSPVHLGLQYRENLVAHGNTDFELKTFDRETIIRDSECIYDDIFFLSSGEIYSVS